MTICYGVTALGARDQVQKQLIDRFGEELDRVVIKGLSQFIAMMILGAVDTIFEKAMGFKKWLELLSN